MAGSNDIILVIQDIDYGGWTSVNVQKSLAQISGTFNFVVTDRFPGNVAEWNIKMGDKCTVEIIGKPELITGYVEDINVSYSDTMHTFQIGGRDKTGDLVDCSFVEEQNEWINSKVREIIADLCAPYDNIIIEVEDSAIDKANEKVSDGFVANSGDSVFELIAKLCRMYAILPVSFGDGKLTLTTAGAAGEAVDVLERGINIKSGFLRQSDKDRFSQYIVKGNNKGNDLKDLVSVIRPFGEAIDLVIGRNGARYRPLIVLAETQASIQDCTDRAYWEMRVRAGQSRVFIYQVQGWLQSNGDLWDINQMVQIKDSYFKLDTSLLIAGINFTVDDVGGSITELELVDKKTYELIREPVEDTVSPGFDSLM